LSKSELRQSALKARESLPGPEVASLSERVARRLMDLPEFAGAATVASYVAKRDEVQTSRIIQSALASGKRVIVPRSVPSSTELVFAEVKSLSELSVGRFGILEPPSNAPPVPLSTSDVVLVPVVAWDEEGNRLGHGKGYFDRALVGSGVSRKVGLAFEAQRVERVPHSATDVPLDIVVTESRALRVGRRTQ
jgi:5-formyltetrahydrofolate cyclo-ligase